MRTEADLMAAFRTLGRRAPDPAPVLQAVLAATRRRRRSARRWVFGGIATAAACAGTAVAITIPLATSGTSPHGITAKGHSPRPAAAKQGLQSARAVLLTAAAHVATAPTSGRYWYLNEMTGTVQPAGTKAHPYDVVSKGHLQVWYPRVPGVLGWTSNGYTTPGFQAGHAVPLTSADWAAWRAAGSPSGWYPNFNWPGHPDQFSIRPAPPPQYSWGVGDGVVGYIEGNLHGLTAAQFARLPTTAAGLRAYLFARVDRYLPQMKPGGTLVWTMALDLLMDPVSSQVRAAAYRVMATIPGIKLLGLIRDPFGRLGYGLRLDGFRLYGSVGSIGVIINPATGLLLDYNYHDDHAIFNPRQRVCYGKGEKHAWDTGTIVKWDAAHCRYLAPYYGPPYSGLLDNYTAFLTVGWVNRLPQMPSATSSNHTNLVFIQVP